MSIDIPRPNINAPTEGAKLEQIRGYLYQISEQLNWALNTMETNTEAKILEVSKQSSSSKSPEEVESNFNELKSLIIKSADIIEAYYDEIETLIKQEGYFLARSEFGDYEEKTTASLTAAHDDITAHFNNIQTISSSVYEMSSSVGEISSSVNNVYSSIGDINSSISHINSSVDEINSSINRVIIKLLETEAYVKSGLLEYSDTGHPIYGIEVGQTNYEDGVTVFKKFARFTADRLAFYDGEGYEMAYISDSTLYIKNVKIGGTIAHGGYDIIASDEFGIYYMWRG